MRRLAVMALLTLALTAVAYAPLPFARPPRVAGRWRVEFANGVVETCEVRKDGTASVSEPARSSPGRAEGHGGTVVIRFADDRVERWTVGGPGAVVEHWFPASAYPAGASVRGVARRAP